jgi:hypothetical protein
MRKYTRRKENKISKETRKMYPLKGETKDRGAFQSHLVSAKEIPIKPLKLSPIAMSKGLSYPIKAILNWNSPKTSRIPSHSNSLYNCKHHTCLVLLPKDTNSLSPFVFAFQKRF